MNILNVMSSENTGNGLPEAFYMVARVKKGILKSSTITTYTRSFGLDWVLNPGDRWKITGQLLGSYHGDFPNIVGDSSG